MLMERERENLALQGVPTASPEFAVYLHCARQSRILAKACPTEADHYKGCCWFWLTMAHQAPGPPLP
jgi:hypothetical protein